MVAEVFKIPNFYEISNRIAEFKLQIAIHYTLEPIKKKDEDGLWTHVWRAQLISSP